MKKYFYKFLKNDNKNFIIFETNDLETFKYQIDSFIIKNYEDIKDNLFIDYEDTFAQLIDRIIYSVEVKEIKGAK